MLRVLRTITSPNSILSRSRLRGSRGLPRVTNCFLKSASVFKWPGASSVSRLYNSTRLFCTGVAVSRNMNRRCSEFTTCQFCVARFLQWWASSTMTRSQCCAATRADRFFPFTNASEASTRSCPLQNSGLSASEVRGGTVKSRPNFPCNSSCHCETSGEGTRISTRFTRDRNRYSRSSRHASIVLPSPTSSASSTRPRNCRRTRRTVSI